MRLRVIVGIIMFEILRPFNRLRNWRVYWFYFLCCIGCWLQELHIPTDKLGEYCIKLKASVKEDDDENTKSKS